ncbi:MAG: threonine--tRNA ligase [Bdellovibrionales bacterium]|jgi:threonyl-tRNA synthetase|nr:threonine--tRNA ligase [Bdellovibrionales bacterium]MBT3527325.1 threonine--tRNA ligase [Bdellovibrionales bacterium]MBT7766481.1 threonine--tRNA ligase [Bdellovibrionales bacterium]
MSNYPLDTIRHSQAHLMAQAVMRVFPNQKLRLGIGPTIEHGFYYDIEMEHRLTDDDLKEIEALMKKIIKEKLPIERTTLQRDEALKFFQESNQLLKVELIEELPADEEISCYQQGEFIDLCRGPHVENTSQLPTNFKLLNTAGAYWRGDSDRQMLQRIYAASFGDRKELKQHLHFLEEAKKRDHRKLGNELTLFHFDQLAPASPFFMPKGAFVYNQLIDFMRRIYKHYGYQEVITPQILDSQLWHTSGHYQNYKDDMYFINADQREWGVKPMNCPCHMLMFKHYKYSYRDLPLRYADFGRLHRYEKSGTLAGLTRVRTFCQDDAHIFIAIKDIQDEIVALMEMFFTVYRHFKFENIQINLSTRPDKRVGEESAWDQAESALKDALDRSDYQYTVKEGDGAFYGPKIDIEISDAIGRFHQLGTIQLDFQLPLRFDLSFTNSEGESEQPVVIHRALLGSLERFFGIYLEHVGGAYPFWLAPTQATIVPINESHLPFCIKLQEQLSKNGFRVNVDDRNETMGQKTRQIQKSKIPYMLAVGDREIEANAVSIRAYGEKGSNSTSINELVELFLTLQLEEMPQELRTKK